MTRFNVAGQYLQLPEGLKLQFTKKNIIFAFDSIECERSVSFDIPSTATNERIMELAKDVHTEGNAMRVRMAAQMQDGIVIKDGYIYITEYDCKSRAYKAIFITGDLLGLKAIKDAGVLANFYQPTETIVWDGDYEGDMVNTIMGNYAYWDGQIDPAYLDRIKPSFNLLKIAEGAAATLGMTISPSLGARYNYMKTIALLRTALYKDNGEEASYGDTIQAKYNLPDIDLVELLKLLTTLSGLVLRIEGNTIYFDDLTTGWSIKPLDRVIEVQKLTRGFGDYAQHNKVVADYLLEDYHAGGTIGESKKEQRDIYDYLVPNVSLEQSKDMYKSKYPITLSGRVWSGHYINLLLRIASDDQIVRQAHWSDDTWSFRILNSLGTGTKNDYLQSLLNISTKVELTARMSLLEYEQLTPKTMLYYNGARYVWTECKWSDNVATLSLQKA